MRFSPIEASEEIAQKYKRYLRTIFTIADPDYSKQFEAELDKGELFAKGPYLDAVDSFRKGASIEDLIEEGILPHDFERIGFPKNRNLYFHQENAIRKCLNGDSVVVSTGTGSGKTESFLIPILSELIEEDQQGTLCPGVRALIIYPMNALANDQIKRLREILKDYTSITFGSYTGQTKRERKHALQEYRSLNGQKEPLKNELISREEMINTPPHILITNYAMLEYLMIRPTENAFFNGPCATFWKYVVLDEAHVYSGSTGIEVSMLLRRLRSMLPTRKIQYILTSATLGSDGQDPEVAEFATRLCNSHFKAENVIRAVRESPRADKDQLSKRPFSSYKKLAEAVNLEDAHAIISLINEKGEEVCDADPKNLIYDVIIHDYNYWRIRELLQNGPQTVYSIAAALECKTEEIEDFVTIASYATKNSSKLLDARYHTFIRASDSAFITIGKLKKLTLTRTKELYENEKSYAVFECGICTFCHSIYLLGKISDNGYFVQKSASDAGVSQDILYLGKEISDEDEDHSLKKESIQIEKMKLCSRCGKLMSEHASAGERCEHIEDEYVTVYHVVPKNEKLTKCVCCENVNTIGIIRQFFTGQEAVTSVLGTALFEALPSYSVIEEKVETDSSGFDFDYDDGDTSEYKTRIQEESAKQFIAFSDSRQAAAFYASYLDKTYTTILYRRLIVEALQKYGFTGNVCQFVSILQSQFEISKVLIDEGLSASKEAWKAMLNELVDNYSSNALQNLGFYEVTIDREGMPSFKALGLTSSDVAEITNVCVQTMLRDAAIAYEEPLNQKDKEFFTFNGHEGAYTLSDSGKKGYHSFIPTRAGGFNKRVEYVEKVLSKRYPKFDRQQVIGFLEKLWSLLIKKGILVNEGIAYKVDTKKLFINTKTQFCQCDSCKKISTYNIDRICPSYKCKGQLADIDLKVVMNDNHYYRMYQELEIRGLRIKEHTAQLSNKKAYEYQNQFINKKIDILSCSTTFEMGVDVGDLETVFMRNMPPSPANYAQRAGRAGRSTQSAAFALTFCTKGNHDFTYFDSPEAMIKGNIRPPVFNINNEKIAIRHVYASALGFFWKKYPQFFSNVEMLIEEKDNTSGMETLATYLKEHPGNLRSYLTEFLPESLSEAFDVKHYGWINRLLSKKEDNPGVLTRAASEYMHELGVLEKAIKDAFDTNQRVDYLRWRINNYKLENVISFLSKKGVLPKYGFPVDTVELSVWDSKNKEKYELDLQRDLAMAISEYAPGSQIVADGNLITSQYIKKMPNMDWKKFDFVYCEDCKTLNIGIHSEVGISNELKECHACGESLEKMSVRTFLIPEFGFEAGMISKAGLIKPKRTYNAEVSYVGYRTDIIFEQHGERDTGSSYEIAYSQKDEMAVLNCSPFYVCSACGYAHLSTNGVGNILPKIHNRTTGIKCTSEKLYKYALGYRFETDVIQVRFHWPTLTHYNQALSIMYALIRGACSHLNIEEKDIAGCLHYFRDQRTGENGYFIVLYDRTPGGSGHVKNLIDESVFDSVLKETQRIVMNCNCGGSLADTSCYNCLRSYSNQRVHDKLQRRYVLDFLEEFFREDAGRNGFISVIPDLDVDKGEYNRLDFGGKFSLLLQNACGLLKDKDKFIGLMKDYLYEYPKERNLLIAAYQMGIHKEIDTSSSMNDISVQNLAKRLEEKMGINKENAIWAVQEWCIQYGENILGRRFETVIDNMCLV